MQTGMRRNGNVPRELGVTISSGHRCASGGRARQQAGIKCRSAAIDPTWVPLTCMYVAGQAQLLSCMYVQSVMVGSRGARSINFRAFSPVVGGLVDLIRTSSAGRKAASWVEKLIRSDQIRPYQIRTDRQTSRQTDL